ncbi:nitroreductase family protein [Leptolyngbya sp. FACHB-321]|uniref:nitroreductase family protein n=1 Tax=Leptolyngbya sp. FACHB-321 TaxID=2692807 RepID=UPI0016824E1D|nr:nitroreductase family protein [Leptolyngbya sp. FACHB-321]MBD2038532.1 nitroreductase family protein [Leptolyngbya sp. FACHB-321]
MKKFIKLIIPSSIIEPTIRTVRGFQTSLLYAFLRLATKSQFLSSLYYALFSNAFAREHRGCIYGQLKYLEDCENAQGSQYLLRRNVHRLEKGLLMRPRRNLFATDYITETFRGYEQALAKQSTCAADVGEIGWAHDVLSQYFTIVSSHPVVDGLRDQFSTLKQIEQVELPRIPYKRNLNEPCSVDYDDFLKLSYRRRSVRWYLQKPVSRNLIDQAITIAALSPSACNRQPFEFRIFDDPEMVKKVASIPIGTKGFSDNFPVIIVVVGKLRAYFSERDRHVIYIDGSLASMSFMLALETLGLSSCPINWPDMESKEKEMSALLGLEFDERPIMLISVGYPDPDGMVAYSHKKSLEQLRRYN